MMIAIILWGGWQFVQSEKFGRFISGRVTSFVAQYAKVSLKFNNIEIGVFPPTLSLNNVETNLEEQNIEFQLRKLSFIFQVSDVWETKLTIKETKLQEGYLKIKKIKTNTKNKEHDEKTKDINPIKVAIDILNSLPVNFKTISLNNVYVNVMNNVFNFEKLNTLRLNDNFYVNLSLHNFNLPQVKIMGKSLTIDQFEFNGQVFENKVIVQKSEIVHGINKIGFNGEIENLFNLDLIKYKLKFKSDVYLPDLHNYLEFDSIGKIEKGSAFIKGELEGKGKIFNSKIFFETDKVVSSFVDGKIKNFEIKVNERQLKFVNVEIVEPKGKLQLLKEFEFFNFKTMKFVEEPIFVSAQNLKLTNALKYLRKSLYPLKGNINGIIKFTLGPKDFHFFIDDEASITDLKLDFSKNNNEPHILKFNKLKVSKAQFDIYGNDFYMKLNGNSGKSVLDITGSIVDDKLDFKSKNSKISLAEIGPLVGLKVAGDGLIDINANGNLNDAKLELKLDLINLNFENFIFDQAKADILFKFKEDLIQIRNLTAMTGDSKLSSDGIFNFKNKSLDFLVKHKKLKFTDASKMYNRIFEPMKFIPPKTNFDLDGDFKITGFIDLNKLKINSKLSIKNIYVFDELLDSVNTDFSFDNKVVSFNNLDLKKNKMSVTGDFQYNMNSESLIFESKYKKLWLQDFNLFNKMPFVFTSQSDGTFSFKKDKKIGIYDFNIHLYKSSIFGKKLADSKFTIFIDDKYEKFGFTGFLFGNTLQFDSNLDFSDKPLNSKFNLDANILDIRKFLSIFSKVDLTNIELEGDLHASIKSEFLKNYDRNLNLNFLLKKFTIKRDHINVNYKNTNENIVVKNGEIKNWDLNIKGDFFSLVSKARGFLGDKFQIKSKAHIDASILEIYENLIAKSSGTFYFTHELEGGGKTQDVDLVIYSNDFSLVTDLLPVQILKSSLKSKYKNGIFHLDYLDGQLQSGRIYAGGEINFNRIIPEINMQFTLDKAGLNILKRSNSIISGKAEIIGNNFPYTVNGKFNLLSTTISDELADFSSSSSFTKTEYKFLPGDNSFEQNNKLAFNIELSTTDPIVVSNSNADLKFAGNVQVLGTEKSPRLDGKMRLVPGYNKIYFKNNEFLLNRGEIYFYEKEKISNPELDFLANSTINEYKLNIKLYGYLDTFSLEMSSDPALGQKDILSLIAFGYTDDISSNLSSQERDSMTQVGVGSILFDRFKINETLKSELGLQINLGTELAQDNTSILNARGSTDSTTTGRVRSATKIEVRKRLNEQMNLSVSSTVGGSIGQRQSMNLNYNLDKNFSLEGIYELKTNEEGEEDIIDNSLGMDFKYRKSFK